MKIMMNGWIMSGGEDNGGFRCAIG